MSRRTYLQKQKSADHALRLPSGSSATGRPALSAGRPLDTSARAALEPRFRHNFADMRVQSDGDLVAAQALEAAPAGVSSGTTSLSISQRGDACEQEAERVAKQVVGAIAGPPADYRATPTRLAPAAAGSVQLQAEPGAGQPAPQLGLGHAQPGGHQLPAMLREPMEAAFGADFGGVRVHADATSDALSRMLSARAFTTRGDIFFRAGAYDPGSYAGQELLAHELTHVVQQQSSGQAALNRYQVEGPEEWNDPVHEMITQQALRQAGVIGKDAKYSDPAAWEYTRGAFWNDDPQGQLFDGRKSFSTGYEWTSQFWDYEAKAAAGQKFGPNDPLLARSHFGDLQFIHGMAAEEGETAEETRKKMMLWTDFTAKVAAGEIKGDTKIGDLGKDMGEFKTLFEKQKDQDIKQLFGVEDEKGDVQKRAAGSLLHLIQDSYAEGHVEREDLGDGRKGSVISFHSYANQDHDKHGKSDQMSGYWDTESNLEATPGARDAIDQSAAVMKLLKEGKSSAEITQYVNQNVLALHDPTRDADTGDAYKKEPPEPSWWDKTKQAAGDLWQGAKGKVSEAWSWLTGSTDAGDYPLPADDQRYT